MRDTAFVVPPEKAERLTTAYTLGPDGALRKLSVRYRGTDVPNDTLMCTGRVTKKYEQDGEHLVECDIRLEKEDGQTTTPGHAIVALPSKG